MVNDYALGDTSVERVLDLENDPWHRLEYAYVNCRAKQYVKGHYGKYEDGKLSVCGIGWAMKGAGMTDEEILGASGNLKCSLKTMLNYKSASRALREYGFDDKTRRKMRTCPMPECAFRGSLQFVLEHINECHKIPIPNIGKLIPIIRSHEKDSAPTLADQLIILKRDFIGLFKKD